jgi:hypothetical protein
LRSPSPNICSNRRSGAARAGIRLDRPGGERSKDKDKDQGQGPDGKRDTVLALDRQTATGHQKTGRGSLLSCGDVESNPGPPTRRLDIPSSRGDLLSRGEGEHNVGPQLQGGTAPSPRRAMDFDMTTDPERAVGFLLATTLVPPLAAGPMEAASTQDANNLQQLLQDLISRPPPEASLGAVSNTRGPSALDDADVEMNAVFLPGMRTGSPLTDPCPPLSPSWTDISLDHRGTVSIIPKGALPAVCDSYSTVLRCFNERPTWETLHAGPSQSLS